MKKSDLSARAEFAPIVAALARCITSARPSSCFRTQLKAELLAAHRQKQARRSFGMDFPPTRRSWQVMATVPVLLGIAAVVWRYSQRSASPA